MFSPGLLGVFLPGSDGVLSPGLLGVFGVTPGVPGLFGLFGFSPDVPGLSPPGFTGGISHTHLVPTFTIFLTGSLITFSSLETYLLFSTVIVVSFLPSLPS